LPGDRGWGRHDLHHPARPGCRCGHLQCTEGTDTGAGWGNRGSVVVMVTVSEMAKEGEYLALFARHS